MSENKGGWSVGKKVAAGLAIAGIAIIGKHIAKRIRDRNNDDDLVYDYADVEIDEMDDEN